MKLLEGLSLEEKQRRFYNASFCPYCDSETEYVSSLEVYQEDHGMIHLCRKCNAHVGCIPNSDQSMGMLARKPLRNLRIEAHRWYDPLIEAKVRQQGVKRKQAQAEGRKWLSGILNLDIEECHIGYMDEDSCQTLIERCKSLYPTEEQIKKRNEDIKYRMEIVHYKAGELGFEFKEFPPMNGKIQMELRDFKNKILYFNPCNKTGRWSTKKKPFPIEDIEVFIDEHFQPI